MTKKKAKKLLKKLEKQAYVAGRKAGYTAGWDLCYATYEPIIKAGELSCVPLMTYGQVHTNTD